MTKQKRTGRNENYQNKMRSEKEGDKTRKNDAKRQRARQKEKEQATEHERTRRN